ncbi:hypothetical protein ANCDUO_08179 [Ancylostoma duodenale]|uniref:G-protein coupled receptors family 1 profile domain-containing protein n=1 Tax=Ancylostoma duodenale TaxID=51022 RepID=A0A0C2CX36_9BILA|nr:hypothetical protein ANCDUO_08179 [Ancylostoma duodenale]
MMILLTVFGNILVVPSVVVYKRMRTFTNILLTSLATAGFCSYKLIKWGCGIMTIALCIELTVTF